MVRITGQSTPTLKQITTNMLGSKSNYFHKDKAQLNDCALNLICYLSLKGYSREEIAVYNNAFDYFCINPGDFDGATLVKDLCDIPGLDIDAMLHDYHYVFYGVGSSVTLKWKADYLYSKGNERKGKSIFAACSRFVGLTLAGLGFIPFARIKRGKIHPELKAAFLKDYKVLIK